MDQEIGYVGIIHPGKKEVDSTKLGVKPRLLGINFS